MWSIPSSLRLQDSLLAVQTIVFPGQDFLAHCLEKTFIPKQATPKPVIWSEDFFSIHMELDTIIRNGTVVTASDVWPCCDIGIKDGSILVVGTKLTGFKASQEIDAEGAYVTPGGIDSHVHLSQYYSPPPGQPQKTLITNGTIPAEYNFAGDDHESGTRSAVAGGTTTVISFAFQFREDDSLMPVIEEYHRLAQDKAYTDYAFHCIITNPSQTVLEKDLQTMIEVHGISSIKIYMTYQDAKLNDYEILDVMHAARKLGITTMVHAENADVVDWMTDHLEKKGMTAPYHHGTSRPPVVEAEATNRVVCLSELMDTPILLVHVSSERATDVIRQAQTKTLPVYAETCPHYLVLTADSMKKDGFEGAKFVCSPPLREESSDVQAIWQGLKNGTFTTVSSDHAATCYNHPGGKMKALGGHDHGHDHSHAHHTSRFRDIPNGLPGLETRLPLLFTLGVLTNTITPQKFVELTSSNPAKLYGLSSKGTIAPGYDADITIWHPQASFKPFKLTNDMLHHKIDYTPFEGTEMLNWPRYTLIRGQVVWRDGEIVGKKGFGKFVKRGRSSMPGPRDVWLSEWRP